MSKLNSEDCSNNTSESEFDMEICNNIYDKQENFLKISGNLNFIIFKNFSNAFLKKMYLLMIQF